jgi:protein transport protein SEC61 subunit beta
VSRVNSSRAAGAGGSSNTMLKLYTDDSPGLRVYVSLTSLKDAT